MTDMSTSIRAKLQYLATRDDGEAVYHASLAGGAAADHDGQYEWHEVEIHNARDLDLSLDRQGFALVHHDSAVTDFEDDTQLAEIYDAEAKDLIMKLTGAYRVEVFDNTRRAASDGIRRSKVMREPSAVIHNDYTQWSAEKRLFELMPDEADALLAGRFAIINIWRSIAGHVETDPLAFCDSETLAPDDLVEVTRQSKDRVGQIQMAHFNPSHQWAYFPRMAMDEVALIKTYDSATDGRTRFTIHTAFTDPTSAADAPPRQSIETRCFVFF